MTYEEQLDKARLLARQHGLFPSLGSTAWVNAQRLMGRQPPSEMYLSDGVIYWSAYLHNILVLLCPMMILNHASFPGAFGFLFVNVFLCAFEFRSEKKRRMLPTWDAIPYLHSDVFELWHQKQLTSIAEEPHPPTRRALAALADQYELEGWWSRQIRITLSVLGLSIRPVAYVPPIWRCILELGCYWGLLQMSLWFFDQTVSQGWLLLWLFVMIVTFGYLYYAPIYRRLPSWKALRESGHGRQ